MDQQALNCWKQAQTLEERHQYADAISMYKKGCQIMLQWLNYDKMPIRAQSYKAKVQEIIQHTADLKNMKVVPAGGAPSDKPSDKKQDGKLDSALESALSQAIVRIKPNISFKDVAGLDKAKQLLQEAVILPYKFPQLFKGKREPWRAILLYGVPGTGKTYIAKALAAECDMVFFSISSSDLVSKYQGESERLVAGLFEMARKEEKAVIFIDEIDSLLSARSSEENESSKRIKTEFMVQMQGVGSSNSGILILAATNFPENLDPAVRRRFEKKIEITLPEWEARKLILTQNATGPESQITDKDLDTLEKVTEGYSASDLATACKECIMMPIRDLQKSEYFVLKEDGKFHTCTQSTDGAQKKTLMEFSAEEQDKVAVPPITIEHLRQSLHECKKTVSQADKDRINKFTKEFGST